MRVAGSQGLSNFVFNKHRFASSFCALFAISDDNSPCPHCFKMRSDASIASRAQRNLHATLFFFPKNHASFYIYLQITWNSKKGRRKGCFEKQPFSSNNNLSRESLPGEVHSLVSDFIVNIIMHRDNSQKSRDMYRPQFILLTAKHGSGTSIFALNRS